MLFKVSERIGVICMTAIDALMSGKAVKATDETPAVKTFMSKKELADLTIVVEEIKSRILKGEQVKVKEAALITVWFRARREHAFVMQKPKAVKKKAPAKRVSKKAEMQALGDKLLEQL